MEKVEVLPEFVVSRLLMRFANRKLGETCDPCLKQFFLVGCTLTAEFRDTAEN